MFRILSIIWIGILFLSCSNDEKNGIPVGKHRLVFHLDSGIDLGVNLIVDSVHNLFVVNGEERIKIQDVEFDNLDTLVFQMPIFDSEFQFSRNINNEYSGFFYDYARGNGYSIPVSIELNKEYRFYSTELDQSEEKNVIYEIYFGEDKSVMNSARADFNFNGGKLSGTFRTPTGDFRYLDGAVIRDGFILSAFDGAHVFLFTGSIFGDSIQGTFYSGSHYKEDFRGVINSEFTLPDASTLTKATQSKFEFAFPNLEGDTISSSQFTGRPLLVQIMGSWCPNCMDETRFLSEYYKRGNNNNVEFISLAFERHSDSIQLIDNLVRYISSFGIEYPVLVASNSIDKEEASEKLPAIDQVISYPTTIFLNKNHEIVHIHTGFDGPATGEAFEDFKRKFDQYIKLINRN